MARRNIKVTTPSNKPDEFSKLLITINKRHIELGRDSPFEGSKEVDMAKFATKLTQANELREQAELLKRQSEEIMQQSRTIYGTDKGQSINTKDTLLYDTDMIKKVLLMRSKGNEEALGVWGFDVVVSLSKGKQMKANKPA